MKWAGNFLSCVAAIASLFSGGFMVAISICHKLLWPNEPSRDRRSILFAGLFLLLLSALGFCIAFG